MANRKDKATETTQKKKEKFLALFRQTGVVSYAAQGVANRATVYKWLKEDPEFEKQFDDAKEEAAELMELEARRRAVQGVDKPVYQKGECVGYIREYSDTLLMFMLKGAKPEKYADRVKQEHSGADGGPIQIISNIPRAGSG